MVPADNTTAAALLLELPDEQALGKIADVSREKQRSGLQHQDPGAGIG